MIARIKTAVYVVLRRVFRASEARFSLLEPRIREMEEQRGELDRLLSSVAALEGTTRRTAAYVDRLAEELRSEIADGDRHVDAAASGRLAGLELALSELRASVRLTQAMVDRAEAPARPPADGGQPAGGAVPARAFAHPSPGLEVLYGTFESRMRGSTEEILDRQRTDHLDRLVALPHPELPVVDLGCGRGELVGLLEAAGQPALGIDTNTAQLLEAGAGTFEEVDLFEWLDGREDGTVRAVVALHVVEHLPADLQVRLVHEARRVLAPGGLLLLETPNVTSLAVGASTFWVDPTHLRPVHPEFLRFLVEDAGFVDVRTELLHPGPLELTGPPGAEELVDDLNGLLLGPSDLALVATVPGPD